jgi:hypothetical protein
VDLPVTGEGECSAGRFFQQKDVKLWRFLQPPFFHHSLSFSNPWGSSKNQTQQPGIDDDRSVIDQ